MTVELQKGSAISYQTMEHTNYNNAQAAHGATDFTDAEMAHVVKEALKSVLLGETDSYNDLVGVIHKKFFRYPEDVALLVTSLKGISLAASYIDISYHKSLLDAIFKMSMWEYGEDVMDELQTLIITLAASSGKLLDSCLNMLVHNFMPPFTPQFKELMKRPIGLKKKGEVLKRVHEALIQISYYMPLAPMRLLQLLKQGMPHISRDEYNITLHVENMLKLESSEIGGVVGNSILWAVVDKLIELDLEIVWSDILDNSSKGMFSMEAEDGEESADDAEIDYGEILVESLPRKRVQGKIAEKLDNLMVLTFQHLESCAKVGRLTKVFNFLLQSFEITILKAYKSKFTQFVLFYACSLDAEGCGVTFAEKLANMFIIHPVLDTRRSAVAYLASYLSRAKFVSLSLVSGMLERLVTWCAEYCQIANGDISPSAHGPFYSACQAIMYVLCFRMQSMMKDPRLKKKLLLMPIEQILKHPLSPFKVCLPTIVQEFLQQAKEVGLFTVSETFVFDDMLESDLSKAFGGSQRLDMFFPFDPCLLKKTDSFIKPNYVYWWMVRDNDEDDIDEGSSDDDEVEDDIDKFDKMSITPKKCMPSRIRPSMSPV